MPRKSFKVKWIEVWKTAGTPNKLTIGPMFGIVRHSLLYPTENGNGVYEAIVLAHAEEEAKDVVRKWFNPGYWFFCTEIVDKPKDPRAA